MGVDRISYLPKEVLCHILSFLPTKLTVRASILSKNWRYLWGSVSALDFDDTLLFNPNKDGFDGIGECYDDGYDSSDEEYTDCWAGNGNAFTDYEIIVDAPKLEVLRYKGYVASGCSFKNCLSVVRAVIDISDNGKRGDVSNIGLKPLTGTYNAKFLSLSGRSMKVFCGVNTSGLHVFSNLTQLKFGCNEYCGQLLPKLLEKSPNLEVLILGKDNAKLNTRDLVKIHMEATAVHS
ncbi:F-box/LRR-repeat protein [Gossypium australe]|uniref:F-box/LRR-repeat protein n=1 Tax=Gossypium australe TaxID=47621 RepID=A0A5B6VTJ1_9ROSI|nr:F-box/LRR-repeat protein [Gossypium australe]